MSRAHAARSVTRHASPLTAWLIACYAFLYAPIAFLVVLSFNESRLVTAWDGFSLRWYATLWHDQTLIAAALLSLRIAAASATLALIIGTLAGYGLALNHPLVFSSGAICRDSAAKCPLCP